ncbi:redoxin domain-containing protein [Candidatus Poribacteria bacterium]|nr:redoxin domain-containing protein [Candidatus Poribacteria bacterium]
MELQENLEIFERNGIWSCAISYDPVEVLGRFAEKHNISYLLLSDVESKVIRRFGILNTNIPEDHPWYGVPFPGTFMVKEDGTVIDKSFYANHGVRDSVDGMLQKRFQVNDTKPGMRQIVKTNSLKATASLSSGTIRRGQIQTFRVEIEIKEGRHIYGRPLPEGYTPTRLTFQAVEGVRFGEVAYPEPEAYYLEKLDETLPVYDGRIVLNAPVHNRQRRESFEVQARLTYQACDDQECYLPDQIDFEIPIMYLDNV